MVESAYLLLSFTEMEDMKMDAPIFDSTNWKKIIVVYHANCYDGFGAALAVWDHA